MPSSLENRDYTVGWICALPLELAAAVLMLDENHGKPQRQHHADKNIYRLGKIGEHNVAIACLPAGMYGIVSAATVASQMLSTFESIRFGLMVGIGGGIPSKENDIRLGDIVVSQPSGTSGGVIQYDFGKTIGGAIRGVELQRIGSLNKPPIILLNALANLQAEHEMDESKVPEILLAKLATKSKDVQTKYSHQGFPNDNLYLADYEHIEDNSTCESCDTSQRINRPARNTINPVVHYGIIASGSQVIKHGATRDRVRKELGSRVICFEMEAAGLMDNFPCLVIRGICDYADSHKNDCWQRYAAAVAAAYAKELLDTIPASEVGPIPLVVNVLQMVNKTHEKLIDVEHAVQEANHASQKAQSKALLDRLLYAEGASFGPHKQASGTCEECYPGTRVEVLEEINEWFQADAGEPSIFWLNGMAGTGKSTLARSITRSFETNNKLGASFFFDRAQSNFSSAQFFFRTIAFQLAHNIPDLGPLITKVIESNIEIHATSLENQFKYLILQPLSHLRADISNSTSLLKYAIVIDALDECKVEDAVNIIRMLSEIAPLKIAKIILTSRPDFPIRLSFGNIQGTYRNFVLTNFRPDTVKRDISIFFDVKLAKVREDWNLLDWPSEEQKQTLIDMATPLFIVAATIIRLLSDVYHNVEPDLLLSEILKSFTTIEGEKLTDLEKTYITVLNRLFGGLKINFAKRIIIEGFQKVIGTIINLASPLSASSLARLLGIRKDEVKTRLNNLHSVLNIPENDDEPIRLFHISFRDFLTGPTLKKLESQFWVDEIAQHKTIATACLERLSNLKQNICNLKSPGDHRATISREKIERCLPLDLQYACRYWVHHLKLAGYGIHDNDQVHDFLKKHFLHWFEALCILDKSPDLILQINALKSLLDARGGTEASQFIHDAHRFTLMNRPVADTTPLQLYSSALIFAPQESIVRKTFLYKVLDANHFKNLPLVEVKWDDLLQTLDPHDLIGYSKNPGLGGVSCYENPGLQVHVGLEFTPRGDRIATSAEHRRHFAITIYDSFTGAEVRTLSGHQGLVCAMAFSKDGRLLVSGSMDKTVRVWDSVTGALKFTLQGNEGDIKAVSFSSDEKSIISIASNDIMRWDSETGLPQQSRGHFAASSFAAFSLDRRLLVSTPAPNEVAVWICDSSGDLTLVPLPGSGIGDRALITLSQNGEMAAIASMTGHSCGANIKVYFIATGAVSHTLKLTRNRICALTFLPDGQLVGLIEEGGGLMTLQNLSAGSKLQVAPIEAEKYRRVVSPRNIALVAISPDGQFSVFVKGCVISVYISSTGIEVRKLKERSGIRPGTITYLAISQDNKRMALVAYGDVMIYNFETGEFIRNLGTLDPNLRQQSGVDLQFEVFQSMGPEDGSFYPILMGKSVWGHEVGYYLPDGRSTVVRFSRNGERVAAGRGSIVKVWESDTGQLLKTLKDQWRNLWELDFTLEGNLMVFGSDDTIKVFKVATEGSLGPFLNWAWDGRMESKIYAAAVSPNNALVAVSGSKILHVWNLITGNLQWSQKYMYSGRYAFAFSPDSKSIVVDYRGALSVHDSEKGNILREMGQYQFENGSYSKVVWSPDHNLIAAINRGGEVKLLDGAALESPNSLNTTDFMGLSLFISPKGERVVAMQAKTIELFDARSSTGATAYASVQNFDCTPYRWFSNETGCDQDIDRYQGLICHKYSIFFPDMFSAIIAADFNLPRTGQRYINVWDCEATEFQQLDLGTDSHPGLGAVPMKLSSDCKSLAVATTSNISIWDIHTEVASQSDIPPLNTSDTDKDTNLDHLYDQESNSDNWSRRRQDQPKFKIQALPLTEMEDSMAFSPNSKLFASVCWKHDLRRGNPIVKVWDITDEVLLRQWRVVGLGEARYDRVTLKFSLDGKLVFCYDSTTVNIQNIYSREKLRKLKHVETGIKAAALSPNNKLLAFYSKKLKKIIIQEVESEKILQEITWLWPLSELTFSTSGRQLKTNYGVVDIEHYDVDVPPSSQHIFHALAINGGWVYRNQERFLWLPHKYRPNENEFTIKGNTIVFYLKGRPLDFLEFTARDGGDDSI
ncbi:hypothetical protein TWF730_001664 [Orbilia blumenaviensis]|uniref:NACHT domain-containing protein n=1 Tax=Orbilia blumenaviensis TaxID=1796055 RepID=A0AAV9UIB9_9PEZI